MSGVPIVPIAATYQKLRDENERLRELTDALGDEALGANADLAKANIALRSELVILRFQLKATLAVVEAARLALSKILAVPCSEWPEYINDAAYILKDAIDGVTTSENPAAKAAGERVRAMERVVEAARAYTCNPSNRLDHYLDHYHRLCAAVAAYEMEVAK